MNPFRVLALHIAACLHSLAAATQARSTGDARRAILAHLEAISRSHVLGDHLAAFDYYAPDYRGHSDSLPELRSKAGEIQAAVAEGKFWAGVDYRVRMLGFSLQGDEATVTTLVNTRITATPPSSPRFVIRRRFIVDTVWRKYDGGWLIQQWKKRG